MPRIRFYVVREAPRAYAVWEMTDGEMAARIDRDPTLAERLDRVPFETREEAEQRRSTLSAK
jgi:hypothetical protein